MSMNLRKDDVLFEAFGIKFMKREELDLTVSQQLPTYRFLIERYYTKIYELPKTLSGKKDKVIREITEDFRYTWIFMNIPPKTYNATKQIVTTFINNFHKLRFTAVCKQKASWEKEVSELKTKLDNGVDIRSFDKHVCEDIVSEYGVEVGEEEKMLYEDNCTRKGSCCTRERWCGGVDTTWWRSAVRRREKLEKQERYKIRREVRVAAEKAALEKLNIGESSSSCVYQSDENGSSTESDNKTEEVYTPARVSNTVKESVKTPPPTTRMRTPKSPAKDNEESFPQIPVRSGYRTINTNIMECLVVMESVYKVDARKSTELLAYIANKVFKQKWSCESKDEIVMETAPKKQKTDRDRDGRKEIGYLEFVLPSRPAIAKMVESFALITFRDMANTIENAKKQGKIVTYGSDDTVKAAGTKRHDVKTGHTTIIGPQKERETFSSGFYPNISHSGKDSAEIVSLDIAKMAVVTNNSFEDMKSMIDFFMNDRAGDGDVMLDTMDIESSRRLKCNAHILLASDNAIDSTFRDAETVIGPSKLISKGAAHVFQSPKNSVWYLGLIALAKLVSPSHSKEPISLYTSYMSFLRKDVSSENEYATLSKKLLENCFRGFKSNRFGRIGELSSYVVLHKPILDAFFDQQVDEHSNKLVLAVFSYIKSQWFLLCCEIAASFYSSVTMRLKWVMGIDEYKNNRETEHSWLSVKEELNKVLSELSKLSSTPSSDHGKDLLKQKCAVKIKEALEHQLSYMAFFQGELDDSTQEKLTQAPLTNLGAESEFASLDNDLHRVGGATSLKTVSQKHIISRNKLFNKDRWMMLSEKEKQANWNWARKSEEARKVREMENDFSKKLKAVEEMSSQAKIKKKMKINKDIMNRLEECKLHGGPLTHVDIDKIDELSDKQVLVEAKYLKKTTGPNIRLRRKEGNRFVNYTTEELKSQIRNVIKPECAVEVDIDELLKTAVKVVPKEVITQELIENQQESGTVAWWDGPLGQHKVGVVLDPTTLQLYNATRYGFSPDGVPQIITDWKLSERITEFYYVIRRNGLLYLII